MPIATLPPLVNCPTTGRASGPNAALSPAVRIGLIAFGSLLVILLVTARYLTPHPAGFGTHEQLGLEPCLTFRLWHLRCPTCGMTTAWSHVVRGEISNAARANLGGAAICFLAMATVPWALCSGICGRWIGWRPSEKVILVAAGGLLTVILIDFFLRTRVFGWI